jgi:hypothetical protein
MDNFSEELVRGETARPDYMVRVIFINLISSYSIHMAESRHAGTYGGECSTARRLFRENA